MQDQTFDGFRHSTSVKSSIGQSKKRNTNSIERKMFTDEERRDMARLRVEMSDILTPDLDTDFNIHRWVHGWHGDVTEAARRFRAYIQNRRVSHLDDAQFLDHFHAHPVIKRCAPYFSFTITPGAPNPVDNSIVMIQRLQGIDYHAMTRMWTCGQFLSTFFVICEWNLRQVLRVEAASGRRSGLTMIFDLENFSLLQYANPQTPIYKIFLLCLQLLQDYYCDMLHRLLIINAPSMVNIVLAIVKRFLRPSTQQKFVTVSQKEELFKYVHRSVLPVRYGGQQRLDSDWITLAGTQFHVDRDSCTLIPRVVHETDYIVPRVFTNKTVADHVDARGLLEVKRHIGVAGSQLYWQYHTNGEIQFTVVRIYADGRKIRLIPFWNVITPKLPEEGSLIITEPGDYALEFFNAHTGRCTVKVEYALDIVQPS